MKKDTKDKMKGVIDRDSSTSRLTNHILIANVSGGGKKGSRDTTAERHGTAPEEGSNRLYNDLAWLWQIWEDPEVGFGDWCNHIIGLLQQHILGEVRTLLNLGCGGGKNAYNLKRRFTVTGVDISQPMLDLAVKLNPECTFVQEDMRNCRLKQLFDSVLIDGSVSYMLNRDDLTAVLRTAFVHLRPGGVMVVSPDEITNTFQQNRTNISYATAKCKPGNVHVVFVENKFDPNPRDNKYECTFVYLIRDDGRLQIEVDRHILGIFPLDVWRGLLREVGFEIHEHTYDQGERVFTTFACVKSICPKGRSLKGHPPGGTPMSDRLRLF